MSSTLLCRPIEAAQPADGIEPNQRDVGVGSQSRWGQHGAQGL